ncbi:MAG TPA: hypothetical protein VFH39_05250 [Candidatus Saccharimonadales bacterium]|nr:hypothetical protein [Candidatus Saccharimonadales bacterium]
MNQLTRIDEFRQVLADYHVSDEARSILAKTKLVLLVGPSSSGRNTIINELLTTGDYHYIVSDTTRKPRINNGVPEQNGREYWFRTEDELLADLQAGMFLEAAIIHNQQVSGISIRELSAAAAEGKIAINEIEVVGGENIHAVKPDALFLFIVPPSFDEWMTRMKARGELPEDETRRRLESAVQELQVALAHDYYRFVVNDTFKHTARDIHAMSQGLDVPDDDEARAIAEQLLHDTQQFLGR